MSLIDTIRAQYPNPKAVSDQAINYRQDYCVGGSLCLYYNLLPRYGDDGRFPDEAILAAILREVNPRLEEEPALDYAHRIITNNDSRWFSAAWTFAAMALNHTPKPKEETIHA